MSIVLMCLILFDDNDDDDGDDDALAQSCPCVGSTRGSFWPAGWVGLGWVGLGHGSEMADLRQNESRVCNIKCLFLHRLQSFRTTSLQWSYKLWQHLQR